MTTAVASPTGSGTVAYNLAYSYTADGSNGQYGNVTCKTNSQTNGPCPSYTFSASTNRITNGNYTFDLAGNETQDGTGSGTHTDQWDAEEHLKSVDNGTTASMTYNALGQRAELVAVGSKIDYLYTPGGEELGTYDGGTGAWIDMQIPALGRRFARYSSYGGAYRVRFYHQDVVESVGMETQEGGYGVGQMLFYPWGQIWQNWSNGGGATVQTRFAAMRQREPYADLDPTPNRMYEGRLGRWLSPDPAGKKAASLVDPQTWNMYSYVRDNPLTLTDPTGLKIDSAECDANKQCAKWKKNYLKHKEAQKQWNALDKNKDLLVKLKWDPKAGESVTGDYKWNDAGTLTGATVTLAGRTGNVDNALNSSEGYAFGSTIKTHPLRQSYVIAHEFGHVEQAQEPGINVLYNWMSEQATRLSQAEQEYGPVGYSKLDWTGPLEQTLDAVHLSLEKGADERAKEVVTGDDDQ